MHATQDKKNVIESRATVAPAQKKNNPHSSLTDSRHHTVQDKLQHNIDKSHRVQQFKAYQEMADHSPQVKQLNAYQTMANNFAPNQVAQFKQNLQEKSIPAAVAVVQRQPFINLKGSGNVDLGPMTVDELQKLYRNNGEIDEANREIVKQELENKKEQENIIKNKVLDKGASALYNADRLKKKTTAKYNDWEATEELISHHEQRKEKVERSARTGIKAGAFSLLSIGSVGTTDIAKSIVNAIYKASQYAQIKHIKKSAEQKKADLITNSNIQEEKAAIEEQYPQNVFDALDRITVGISEQGLGSLANMEVSGAATLSTLLGDISKDIQILEDNQSKSELAADALLILRPIFDRLTDFVLHNGYDPIPDKETRRTKYGSYIL